MELGARGSLRNCKDWRTLALTYSGLNELSVQMIVFFPPNVIKQDRVRINLHLAVMGPCLPRNQIQIKRNNLSGGVLVAFLQTVVNIYSTNQ